MTSFSINYQFNKLVKVTLSEKQALTEQQVTDNNIEMVDKSAKSPHFFQNNKPWERKYTTATIKSRTFLSNIAYVCISKEGFYYESFTFDVYLLVTRNLNTFSLDRTLGDKNKHEMIYMLWKECAPQRFYQHIYKEKNFLFLNRKNVLQPKLSEIITDFLKERDEDYKDLRNNLSQ